MHAQHRLPQRPFPRHPARHPAAGVWRGSVRRSATLRLAVWAGILAGLAAILLAGRIGDGWLIVAVVLVASAASWAHTGPLRHASSALRTLPVRDR
jgi:hypothetical protein